MKIEAGALKRITFDPRAVEDNKPRVRRHEPVFVVEVEEGDSFKTYRAHAVEVEGKLTTQYGIATGFIRYTTSDEVTLQLDYDAATAVPVEPTKTKSKRGAK